MSEQKTYHPLVEKIRREKWGKLGLVEPEDVEQYALLTPRERAQYHGARADCPVVNTLADNVQYGPSYQIKRYSDVARTALQLADVMKETGSPLVEEFLTPVDLTLIGGKQLHDADWVPSERMNQASGSETYFVYTLARQVIDSRNAGQSGKEGASNKRQALNEVAVAESLPMAVAKLGLLCEKRGIESGKITARMFPEDWAEELPRLYWEPIFGEVKGLFEDLRQRE
jgi:hypothetical protein